MLLDFFFKQKTAYEITYGDWSSDVCSSDLMFAPQMAEIVTYVEQLNEIDTAAVDPALGGLTPEGERTDSSRPDEVKPSLGQKVALDQAPDAAAGHFRVPQVLSRFL